MSHATGLSSAQGVSHMLTTGGVIRGLVRHMSWLVAIATRAFSPSLKTPLCIRLEPLTKTRLPPITHCCGRGTTSRALIVTLIPV